MYAWGSYIHFISHSFVVVSFHLFRRILREMNEESMKFQSVFWDLKSLTVRLPNGSHKFRKIARQKWKQSEKQTPEFIHMKTQTETLTHTQMFNVNIHRQRRISSIISKMFVYSNSMLIHAVCFSAHFFFSLVFSCVYAFILALEHLRRDLALSLYTIFWKYIQISFTTTNDLPSQLKQT